MKLVKQITIFIKDLCLWFFSKFYGYSLSKIPLMKIENIRTYFSGKSQWTFTLQKSRNNDIGSSSKRIKLIIKAVSAINPKNLYLKKKIPTPLPKT